MLTHFVKDRARFVRVVLCPVQGSLRRNRIGPLIHDRLGAERRRVFARQQDSESERQNDSSTILLSPTR